MQKENWKENNRLRERQRERERDERSKRKERMERNKEKKKKNGQIWGRKRKNMKKKPAYNKVVNEQNRNLETLILGNIML